MSSGVYEPIIRDLTGAVSGDDPPRDKVNRVFQVFAESVVGRQDLVLDRFQPGERSYARHLVHRDPENRFVLIGIVWRPGQGTPIHDHPTWGVVGVVQGSMRFVNYAVEDQNGSSKLVHIETTIGPRGAVTTVFPPHCDVHRMENADKNQVAVTLHCYGRELDHFFIYSPETGEKRPASVKYDTTP